MAAVATFQGCGGSDEPGGPHHKDLQVVYDHAHAKPPTAPTAEQRKSYKALHALANDEFFEAAMPYVGSRIAHLDGYKRATPEQKKEMERGMAKKIREHVAETVAGFTTASVDGEGTGSAGTGSHSSSRSVERHS